jgi:hypothetical protein
VHRIGRGVPRWRAHGVVHHSLVEAMNIGSADRYLEVVDPFLTGRGETRQLCTQA